MIKKDTFNEVPLLLWGWEEEQYALWVFTDHGHRLHAVSRLDTPSDDWSSGAGVTVCQRHGHLSYPGVFSRLGMPRCAHCCRMLKIPRGIGHPKNDPELRPLFGYQPTG